MHTFAGRLLDANHKREESPVLASKLCAVFELIGLLKLDARILILISKNMKKEDVWPVATVAGIITITFALTIVSANSAADKDHSVPILKPTPAFADELSYRAICIEAPTIMTEAKARKFYKSLTGETVAWGGFVFDVKEVEGGYMVQVSIAERNENFPYLSGNFTTNLYGVPGDVALALAPNQKLVYTGTVQAIEFMGVACNPVRLHYLGLEIEK